MPSEILYKSLYSFKQYLKQGNAIVRKYFPRLRGKDAKLPLRKGKDIQSPGRDVVIFKHIRNLEVAEDYASPEGGVWITADQIYVIDWMLKQKIKMKNYRFEIPFEDLPNIRVTR